MKTRFHLATISLLTALVWLVSTGVGLAAEAARRAPELPKALHTVVDQVLESKPGDFFVVLKNGLTILVREQRTSEAVSARVFVRAGSLYERKNLLGGLSHYLEHVVAGGSTRSFSESEARERLRRIGGATNAYTSNDRTVYYIDTVSAHWKEALKLLLSYVSECQLAPAEVEREKGVIQQEMKLGENNPRRELWELFIQTAYLSHPVRNPVIGLEEVFVRQDRDALAQYYAERYQPQNMLLTVVGAVNAAEVLQFVADDTKDFVPKSGVPGLEGEEPPQLGPRWREKEVPLARLTQVVLGFPSVSLTHKDMYALDVLSMILGDGQTSRLYRRLKDQEQKVLSVDSSNWTPSYVAGQFMIDLDLPAENWPGVLNSVQQEIERFKTAPVTPKELEQAKKQVIAQHIFRKEKVSSMAASLGGSFLDTGDPYFDDAYVDGVRQVTPEKIRDVAKRYLTMDRSNVAVIKPAKQKDEAAAATPAISGGQAEASTVTFQETQNKLQVSLKRDASLPLVTIQLYGLGGLLLEDAQHPGLAKFTGSLLTAGTKKRTKLAIAQAIEGVGGAIHGTAANSTYSVTIKVLKEDLDLALDILADIVQNAQFPQEEIEKKRQDFLLAIQRQDEDWQTEITRLFKKNYFQDHPYGHDPIGTEESVRSFSRADVLACYQRMVDPARSALAIYGDIPLNQVVTKIQQKLGTWKASGGALPGWPEETHPMGTRREVEVRNDKTSAALFLGTAGLTIGDAERPALDVLGAVISGIGYPSGRLHQALRGGEEDLVYVVHGFPFYGLQGGYFGVITQTTMAHLAKVQEIVESNLDRMQNEPVSEDEMRIAKDLVITMHQLHLESLDAQAQSAAVNEALGLGWNYDERYPDLVRAVKADDVQRLAQKLFAQRLLVKTIPEKPVEAIIPPEPTKRLHPF
jgi:zinc protease